MLTMSQQYQEMFQEPFANRSPGTYRGSALNRQPSRHFEGYGMPPSGLYTADDHAAQGYDSTPRFDRMPPSNFGSNYPYDNQTWNYGGANTGANPLGGTGRVKPQSRRGQLPTNWLDQSQMPPPMPPLPNMHQMNGYQPQMGGPPPRGSPPNDMDELIATALVIKNIPFAVKKEQLTAIMENLNCPLPYAFNYHFDNGVFRGLAFANFSTSEETAIVIERMNHLEVSGRKLRVEYKKMLPAAERDRIEREKRERRGQLQEQHQPTNSQLNNQGSMTSLKSNHRPPTSPSPISQRAPGTLDVDLNDPASLNFYTDLMLFKKDPNREALIFPSDVTPEGRRVIHTLAHHMGLEHRSEGEGEMRQVQIFKSRPTQISPSVPQLHSPYYNDSQRRVLNRAATVDFSEGRDTNFYGHTLGRTTSGLTVPGSPGLSGMNASHNLRAAKSFADLRSYTPSPALSTASFPVGLSQNVSRYTENYGQGHSSQASGTPNLTPTSAGGMNSRDADFLNGGMANLSLGFVRANASNARLNSERDTHISPAGAIGSQRPINGHYEDNSRNGGTAVPERQPRGPGSEWSAGFRPRQNGHAQRGSGEHDLTAEKLQDDNRFQDSSDRTGGAPSAPSRYN